MILFPEEASTCTSHNSSDLPTRVHRGGGGEEISKNGSMEPGTHTTEIRRPFLSSSSWMQHLTKKVDVWDQGEITASLCLRRPGREGKQDGGADFIFARPSLFLSYFIFFSRVSTTFGLFYLDRERKKEEGLRVVQFRRRPRKKPPFP